MRTEFMNYFSKPVSFILLCPEYKSSKYCRKLSHLWEIQIKWHIFEDKSIVNCVIWGLVAVKHNFQDYVETRNKTKKTKKKMHSHQTETLSQHSRAHTTLHTNQKCRDGDMIYVG